MANDSDSENEREMSYREPTMVERIGPEEARRLLMDDDDDDQNLRRVEEGKLIINILDIMYKKYLHH